AGSQAGTQVARAMEGESATEDTRRRKAIHSEDTVIGPVTRLHSASQSVKLRTYYSVSNETATEDTPSQAEESLRRDRGRDKRGQEKSRNERPRGGPPRT